MLDCLSPLPQRQLPYHGAPFNRNHQWIFLSYILVEEDLDRCRGRSIRRGGGCWAAEQSPLRESAQTCQKTPPLPTSSCRPSSRACVIKTGAESYLVLCLSSPDAAVTHELWIADGPVVRGVPAIFDRLRCWYRPSVRIQRRDDGQERLLSLNGTPKMDFSRAFCLLASLYTVSLYISASAFPKTTVKVLRPSRLYPRHGFHYTKSLSENQNRYWYNAQYLFPELADSQ